MTKKKAEDHKGEAKAKSFSFVKLLSVLIFLGLVLVVSKLVFDINVLKKNLEPESFLKQDNLILEELAAQQKNLMTQLKFMEKQQQSFQESLSAFQSDMDDVKNNQNKAGQLLSSKAELEYLIERATFKLNYENDTKGALRILKHIHSKTRAGDKLNNAVEEMIKKIQPYAEIKMSQLVAALDKIDDMISQLTLVRTHMSTSGQIKQEQSSEKPTKWQDKLMASLKEVVVVQRIDQPVKPVLNEYERSLLKYQLKLKTQQAKMALLTRQYHLFQSLVRSLTKEVSQYVDVSQEEYAVLQTQLDTLNHVTFPTELPDVRKLQKVVLKAERVATV